jgi:hypothetical protein
VNTAVFLGPSLPLASARALLDATYLPPVQQGDVLRAVRAGARVIAIIDGYFATVPAVWHKEILFALHSGVHVFGAASMGALRAAELHSFGMVGVGEIFAGFRDGLLTDDDEVAVCHGPAETGYRELSDALVNVRDALRAATAAGLLASAQADELLALCRSLHYGERSYERLVALTAGGPLAAAARTLAGFAAEHRPSLKQRDALALLAHLGNFLATDPPRFAAGFAFERTVFFDALAAAVAAEVSTPEIETLVARGGEDAAVTRKKLLLRRLARAEVERLGLTPTPVEVQAMADEFRARFGLRSAAAMRAWLDREGLSLASFSAAMRDFVAIATLQDLHGPELDADLLDYLRLNTARSHTTAGTGRETGVGQRERESA